MIFTRQRSEQNIAQVGSLFEIFEHTNTHPNIAVNAEIPDSPEVYRPTRECAVQRLLLYTCDIIRKAHLVAFDKDLTLPHHAIGDTGFISDKDLTSSTSEPRPTRGDSARTHENAQVSAVFDGLDIDHARTVADNLAMWNRVNCQTITDSRQPSLPWLMIAAIFAVALHQRRDIQPGGPRRIARGQAPVAGFDLRCVRRSLGPFGNHRASGSSAARASSSSRQR
ncbi:hypothetical protein ACIA8C_05070 [Nocardia sp. NPDC051321]|uniref:hypothetical protein n=1 Tax=Nocardia sp. NPDC051321 TaxID=3364323 RepID=UPI0037BD84A7